MSTRRPFPFGIASLVVGAALFVGAPFAIPVALRFDDNLGRIIGVYLVGGLTTLTLAILAFARPRTPPPPPFPGVSSPGGPVPPQPFVPPPTGDRTAATAGVALAGIGCTAIAGVIVLGLIILAIAVYFLIQLLLAIFGAH